MIIVFCHSNTRAEFPPKFINVGSDNYDISVVFYLLNLSKIIFWIAMPPLLQYFQCLKYWMSADRDQEKQRDYKHHIEFTTFLNVSIKLFCCISRDVVVPFSSSFLPKVHFSPSRVTNARIAVVIVCARESFCLLARLIKIDSGLGHDSGRDRVVL